MTNSNFEDTMFEKHRIRVRLSRVFVLVLATLALGLAEARDALPKVDPAEVGLSPERLERLSKAMQTYVDKEMLPGAVVTVARRGKIAYQEAFGQRDIEAELPMRTDTIFRIASQTKAIVSVGIMVLQEQGALLISDPVGKYLPEFRETTVAVANEEGGYEIAPAQRSITIHDLLTHTAGIGYGGGVAADRWENAGITGWYFSDRDEPIGATVARMAGLPFESQPGEAWVYGYSTDILGVIIEVVSDQSLDRFLQTRILSPLGMTDTHFYLPPSKRNRLAAVYSAHETDGLSRAPDPGGMVGQGAYVDGPRKSFSGGAGLLSTADDYTRFLQMLLNGGTLDGKRILGRKTVELMTVNHIGGLRPEFFNSGRGFGLGFSIILDVGKFGMPASYGEFGWSGAYHSTYWVNPEEELVVTYMSQVRPATGLDDHARLRALVYQAIVD